ncbi:MAG: transglycosylase domain-containing protein, partial [Kitasatospora sp.]|nr:transglycosylase domain-containing protein [Kitasatospora sp.]
MFDPIVKGLNVGRLVTLSALGGVLAAGLAVPLVGSIGMAVKTAADKFNTMSTGVLAQVPQRSEILDSKGNLIAYVYGVDEPYYYGPGNVKQVQATGIDRAPVSYSQISANMRQAIVAIEDDRYWQHGAIDFKGTVRAIVNNLEHKPIQGGSTLAQQDVKNVLILTAKNPLQQEGATSETLSRKIHELRLAVQIEHQQSKADILAGYLNDAYFGYPIIGIQTAARAYFKRTASKLSLAQAAMLAGMVENPSAYDPVTYPANALQRRNTVLARMA